MKDRKVEGVAKYEYQSRIHLPTAEMLATNNSAVDNFMFVEMVGEDVFRVVCCSNCFFMSTSAVERYLEEHHMIVRVRILLGSIS